MIEIRIIPKKEIGNKKCIRCDKYPKTDVTGITCQGYRTILICEKCTPKLGSELTNLRVDI